MASTEPVLTPTPRRFVMFPIEYPDIFALYKTHVRTFWTVEEIDISRDLEDWQGLDDDERHFIKYVLAFFAASDGIVNENITENFATEVQISESRAFYAFQSAIEQIHSEMYSLLIDTYIKDTNERATLFGAIDNIECIKRKATWATRWMQNGSFAQRLVAFAVVEGVFFSGSFCAIFWLKKRGIMPGLTLSNEFISRDENLHTQHACLLYSKLNQGLDRQTLLAVVTEGVAIEQEFIGDALPCALIGMNKHLMSQYIEFVADRLLADLGGEKHYNVANPVPFMELISLEGKTNFFERRVSDYARPVGNCDVFGMDGDF